MKELSRRILSLKSYKLSLHYLSFENPTFSHENECAISLGSSSISCKDYFLSSIQLIGGKVPEGLSKYSLTTSLSSVGRVFKVSCSIDLSIDYIVCFYFCFHSVYLSLRIYPFLSKISLSTLNNSSYVYFSSSISSGY